MTARKGTPIEGTAEIKAARLATRCFFAGTPVATQMGYAAVETVSVNDSVYAYDFSSGVWVFGRVVETYQNDYIGEKIRIKVQGDWIESTRHHPVWVIAGNNLENRPRPEHVVRAEEDGAEGEGRWVDACDLQVGDVLLTKDHQGADRRAAGRATIDAIEVEFVAAKVYNFQVEGLHNYAVGYWQVLVHNNAIGTPEELGHLVVVEYKGEGGKLAPNQMKRPWILEKIAELEADKSPWAAKLQAALSAGKLKGIAIRSTAGPNGISEEIGNWIY